MSKRNLLFSKLHCCRSLCYFRSLLKMMPNYPLTSHGLGMGHRMSCKDCWYDNEKYPSHILQQLGTLLLQHFPRHTHTHIQPSSHLAATKYIDSIQVSQPWDGCFPRGTRGGLEIPICRKLPTSVGSGLLTADVLAEAAKRPRGLVFVDGEMRSLSSDKF